MQKSLAIAYAVKNRRAVRPAPAQAQAQAAPAAPEQEIAAEQPLVAEEPPAKSVLEKVMENRKFKFMNKASK